MKRPIDPRKHGLREPEKVHTKVEVIRLSSGPSLYWDKAPMSLRTIVKAWEKALIDHQSIGQRIVKDPTIDKDLNIIYTVGWDNKTYGEELINYNQQVAKYEEELAAFLSEEKELKELPPDHQRVIGIKIEKAKQRLANLEAVRDNKPLPFP